MFGKFLGAALVPLLATASSVAADLTVPHLPSQAQTLIIKAIGQIHPSQPDYRRFHKAVPYGAALFPPDRYFDVANGGELVARWLALPSIEREHDVLITPDVDFYWPADGMAFACEFIVHMELASASKTRLTILQTHPVMYLGKKFHALGRTGPGFYMDLKPAPPSPQAIAALRNLLASALDAGQL